MHSRLTPPFAHSGRLAAALFLGLVLVIVWSGAAAQADNAPWSAEEVQFVYELNHSRWYPTTVERQAGLAPRTILPSPPLAINDHLASAAGFRADEMARYDYFAHQSPITGLWPNKIARNHGYRLPYYWPDAANNIESIHRGNPTILGVLQSFVNSPTHRNHVMGQGWFGTHEEIGVGAHLGDRVWAILTATEGTGTLFITGVVFNDRNGNQRMDLGEGLPGVTVSTGTKRTLTNAGGGWTLPVPPGDYRVTASGNAFAARSAAVKVDKYNVEIDFISAPGRTTGPRPQVYEYATCNGLKPTILGTGARDVITGTPGDDVIFAGGGNDQIDGGGGNDTICGGGGNDLLMGGDGRDLLIGGDGSGDRCLQGEQRSGCES